MASSENTDPEVYFETYIGRFDQFRLNRLNRLGI